MAIQGFISVRRRGPPKEKSPPFAILAMQAAKANEAEASHEKGNAANHVEAVRYCLTLCHSIEVRKLSWKWKKDAQCNQSSTTSKDTHQTS
jgi:hypothetical protein